MNPRLRKIIDRHLGLSWKGSHVLAQATEKLLAAMQEIMSLNKMDQMRTIAAKTSNEVNALAGEDMKK